MKKTQRWLCMLLVFCMMLSVLPFTAAAEEPPASSADKSIITIGTANYTMKIEKSGFRYSFEKTDGTTIIEAHETSGLRFGAAGSEPSNVVSTEYKGEANGIYTFRVKNANDMEVTLQYTGRGFYSMSSNEDYPTAAELIDYAYGRYNIHAYTIEVYSPGTSEDGDISSCKWENTLPEAKWVFYSRDEVCSTLGLDPDAITDKDGVGLAEDEGLWFYTSPTNQMVDRAPDEQDVMVRGCRDAILTMIESEPSGSGYQNPGFYK